MRVHARRSARPTLVHVRILALLVVLVPDQCDASGGGKRCDVFQHNGMAVCGPGLFLIGMGKCGTNAFKSYTLRYKDVKWHMKSEIDFNPHFVKPEQLMEFNPNVVPGDSKVWFIKHNIHTEEVVHSANDHPRNARNLLRMLKVKVLFCL